MRMMTRSDQPIEAASRRRRVLILAYFFPPDSSGGVPRTVQFIKYLRRLGWDSTVIAPNWEGRPGDAQGFATSIPHETEIIRAGSGGDDSPLWKALHRLPLFWRVEDAAREAFQYPDRFATWMRDALPVARRALAQQRHSLIYSTSPPVTSHRIAMYLKEEFGIPWIADFRDPWTDNALMYGSPPRWRKRLDLRLEHRIHDVADRTIANTESNRATLIAKHGVPSRKVVTITNGYDEEDFERASHAPPTDRYRITYCGSFYSTYNPDSFLRAFTTFLAREPDAKLTLTLAGSSCAWARDNIREPQILSRLELLGDIPHHEVCALLGASHLLLHTYPTGIPYSVPGKLYEYLRSGRPIVAVCDRPSEVATLLERTAHGRAFRPDETDQLATYLSEAYGEWKRNAGAAPPRAPDETIHMYDRSVLSGRLADEFDAVAR
jgi:glycosyltransferase involved in cell wall biosynthesis